jgi:hypothetical protein
LIRKSIFLTTLFSLTAAALASPEHDSARIAGNLRAFSDDDWAKIAGDRTSEKYEVARGDTLWDISGRLFGDVKVWPKIWEINNATVLNPHMIEPRMALLFSSGSGTSLPTIALGKSVNNAGISSIKSHYILSKDDHPGPVWDEKTPFPSSEWRNLPRQSWENVAVDLPPNIDKDGFDTRNRIYLRKPATGLELPHYVACEPVKPLAEIVGTRSVTTFVYRGSEVTIKPRAGTTLEINQTYTLLDAKTSELATTERKALSYDILGTIKVLGLQNGTYVGEIATTRETVPRGALLVPEIKRIEKKPAIAGEKKVIGTILADRRTGAFMSGQYKWVYVDRGTRDGVKPGMIFRIFQNSDPKTNLPLTKGDVFVSGDAQVLQGCEDFSIATFVWSRGEVPEKYQGILLTDMNDEKIRFYFTGEAGDQLVKEAPAAELAPPSGIVDQPKPEPSEAIVGPGPTENAEVLKPVEPTADKPPGEADDWLDKLDNHQELQTDEENELKELEKFHETEAKAPPAEAAPAPEAPAAAGADLPPPPSDAELPPAPPEASAVPPPPSAEFPSEEPVVETPSTMLKSPAVKSAQAPKVAPAPEAAPVDENSVEGLPPL